MDSLGEAAFQVVCPGCRETMVGGLFLVRKRKVPEPEDLQAGKHKPGTRATSDPYVVCMVEFGEGSGGSSGGGHVAATAASTKTASEHERGGGLAPPPSGGGLTQPPSGHGGLTPPSTHAAASAEAACDFTAGTVKPPQVPPQMPPQMPRRPKQPAAPPPSNLLMQHPRPKMVGRGVAKVRAMGSPQRPPNRQPAFVGSVAVTEEQQKQ